MGSHSIRISNVQMFLIRVCGDSDGAKLPASTGFRV